MQREQVPVRYRQNAQTAALLDTLGLTADELAVLVEDVKAQFFVDTATWALPLWEAQVGISAKPGTSDDARRDAIELFKPAHLRFISSGLTWYALESVGMTWQQIEDAEYTWDQFEGLTPVYGSDD